MSKLAILYWTGTGNTELIANIISENAQAQGFETKLILMENAIQDDIDSYDYLALGCPSMGAEVLEEDIVEPFIDEMNFTGKKIMLFGSYDWGDGEWMRNWAFKMNNEKNAFVHDEGLIVHLAPDEDALNECEKHVKEFLKS
ncbi:MAG: flavodoxin domain-containing protein [Bacillota bacterium]|nr:flavodoxin domain-containing protein [Bacillota bacterium]